jgi:hypothetical protein
VGNPTSVSLPLFKTNPSQKIKYPSLEKKSKNTPAYIKKNSFETFEQRLHKLTDIFYVAARLNKEPSAVLQ